MSSPTPDMLHRMRRVLMRTRRKLYSMRRFIPGWREHHILEAMVGPLGFWDELQQYQLRVVLENGLQPVHAMLDIGCGPLQGGVAFIQHLDTGNYAGIDIDQARIDMARRLVTRHHLETKKPRLFVSTTFGETELGDATFNFMWASQIIYYFKDPLMHQMLDMARRRLRTGGRLLADSYAPDHYEFTRPENPGVYIRHTLDSLRGLAAAHELNVRCLGVIGDFGYPKKLTLRSNPLYEFTAADAGHPGPP